MKLTDKELKFLEKRLGVTINRNIGGRVMEWTAGWETKKVLVVHLLQNYDGERVRIKTLDWKVKREDGFLCGDEYWKGTKVCMSKQSRKIKAKEAK